MNNDYVDFKFGDHWASEFSLLAVSNSDRYNPPVYGSVNSNTAAIMGKKGVYKWKTQVNEKVFNLNIAFDSVTIAQLNGIKKWLEPHKVQKLVFAEEPYKYYWASLNSEINFSHIPFVEGEKQVGGKTIIEGVYKGEMEISFICIDNNGYSEERTFEGIEEEPVYGTAQGSEIVLTDADNDYIEDLEIQGDTVQFAKYNNVLDDLEFEKLKDGNQEDWEFTNLANTNSLTQNYGEIAFNSNYEKSGIAQDQREATVDHKYYVSAEVNTDSMETALEVAAKNRINSVSGRNINIDDALPGKVQDLIVGGDAAQEEKNDNMIDNSCFRTLKNWNSEGKISSWSYVGDNDGATHFTTGKQYSGISQKPTRYISNSKYYLSTEIESSLTDLALSVETEGARINKVATPFVLDSSNSELEGLKIYASSEQILQKTENLLKNNLISQTLNGITATVNENKSITLNGTATADTEFCIFGDPEGREFIEVEGEEFGAKINNSVIDGVTGSFYWWEQDSLTPEIVPDFECIYGYHSQGTSKIMRFSNFCIKIKAGTVLNAKTVYPMLTATRQPPGTYVPNEVLDPEHPCEIRTVNPNVTAAIASNQLFGELGFNKYADGVFSYSEINVGTNLIPVKGGTSYFFYNLGIPENVNGEGNRKIFEFDERLSLIKTYDISNTTDRLLYTLNANTCYFMYSVTDDFNSKEDAEKYIIDNADSIVLEERIKFTNEEEMLEGDSFEWGYSPTPGYKTYYTWKKVILNGSEDYGQLVGGNGNSFTLTIDGVKRVSSETSKGAIISDRLWGRSRSEIAQGLEGIAMGKTNDDFYKDIQIYCKATKDMTIEEFKTWLSAHPITLYVKLARPKSADLINGDSIFANFKTYRGLTWFDTIKPLFGEECAKLKFSFEYKLAPIYQATKTKTGREKVSLIFSSNLGRDTKILIESLKTNFLGKSVYVRKPLLINLSLMFGYGNEPTKEWCDANLNFNNSAEYGAPSLKTPNRIEFVGDDINLYNSNKHIEMTGKYRNQYNETITDINYIGLKIPVLENMQYSVISDIETKMSFVYFDENFERIYGSSYNTSFCPFITPRGCRFVTIGIKKDAVVKIKYGRTRVDYTDYNKANIETLITTNGLDFKTKFPLMEGQELLKIGNIQDTIEADGIHKRIKKRIFDGTEEWNHASGMNNNYRWYTSGCEDALNDDTDYKSICNCFKKAIVGEEYSLKDSHFILPDGNIHFNISQYDSNYKTLEKWQQTLQELKNNENPLTVYYALENEIIIPFTPEQQQWYDNFKIYSNTQITTSSNPKAYYSFTYEVDDTQWVISTKTNEWEKLGMIYTNLELTPKVIISGFTDVSKVIKVRNPIAIDLTQEFGRGREPSLEWCQANLTERNTCQYGSPSPQTPSTIYSVGDANYPIEITSEGENSNTRITKYLVLDKPLMKLPDGTREYVNKDGTRRRMWKDIINGTNEVYSAGWYIYDSNYIYVSGSYSGGIVNSGSAFANFYCDKFKRCSLSEIINTTSYQPPVNCMALENSKYYVCIRKDLIGVTEEERTNSTVIKTKWKNWLKNNPITIYYEKNWWYGAGLTKSQLEVLNSLFTRRNYNRWTFNSTPFTDPQGKLTYRKLNYNTDIIHPWVTASNLLDKTWIYEDDNIHLSSYVDVETGDADKSGITNARKAILLNSGTTSANLNLKFDYITIVSPLTIIVEKGKLTSSDFRREDEVSRITINPFINYQPFKDIYDNVPSNWYIEIDSELAEVYLKHKTDSTKVLNLNRFNVDHTFLTLADCNFVDYNKPLPTLRTKIIGTAIENTVFNRLYVQDSAEKYRLKNVSVEWKHTYL